MSPLEVFLAVFQPKVADPVVRDGRSSCVWGAAPGPALVVQAVRALRGVLCLLLMAVSLPLQAGLRGGERDASVSLAPPEWYVNFSEEGVRFGKGEDADRDKAIDRARSDISKKIRVFVSSTTTARQERDVDRKGRESVTSGGSQAMETVSAAVLEDTEVFREQHVGGVWYVVVVYDDSAMPKRIWRRIRNDACPATNRDEFLQHTPLAAQIRELGGCTAALQLSRRGGKWVLEAGDRSFGFREGDNFERLLFPSGPVAAPGLAIEATPSEITHNDAFQLKIQSAQNGYVTLYNVFGAGLVTEVAGNLPVSAEAPYHFPDENFGNDLVGALLPGTNATASELYVAVFSETPFANEGHQLTSARIENSEEAATIDHLFTQLRGKQFAVAALKIRPKK